MDSKELRKEWIKKKTGVSLGNVCYNCGSTEDVELHHIVPLSLGGTNNITNIAVLCHKCHMASHYGRNINEYKSKKKPVQIKRKLTFKEKIETTIPDYINGKISEMECKKILGIDDGVDIRKMKFFKKYVERC